MLSAAQHSPEKKRPRTTLCWAQAFKEKEETKHFERVLIMHQLRMPRIDKDHEEWRLATKAREMFSQPT
jgi:hypothetical protein